MNHLVPCPSCARHVRHSEAICPFCSAELSLGHAPAPVLPRGRLGRAATFAFGASLVGATSLVACGGSSEEGKEEGGGGTANKAGTTSSGGDGAPMPVYGAPAAGMGGAGTGGDPSFAGSAIVPMYGSAPPGGGGGAIYGAPPAGTDAGGNAGSGGSNTSAGAGGRNLVPIYGTPPMPPKEE